ncbi:saccharopine dehydrogenase NADP-binding domain-containing protein [Myroides marinus]|jgi:saccharopine dehydrogenase-like NADP-dependent oxidoreductase|uniref:Saccharopine dehydrogenase, NADP-dependent n=1 Tax=Myroides marinus TaxID=703342 RepID=A0A1H6RGZ7_9FLAO|nr:saccharopine dehydrogenase C-terminal domain-containing protein [Myroides marinus]MDR0193480.1 saccharopine dehydrogenase NADP-binding domain-containing protein [Myroides sp.]MDM1345486.1 saccharopine dehydrogenase NADP-binding domain-containing protein [Myroides marinus]MDM1349075.1 saccharopine dehydrogenase NADP-binding domain-containing protein [Myroides marinus]MDM1352721.1 saccharopine dehydrogenase NADP-binding domain-containing protein [Myroides marinus]MDM1356285.1 saccharopine deh
MTKEILIVGAGRSSSSLIKYLLDKSKEENLHLTIGDLSLESAQQKAMNHPNATPIAFDLFNESERQALVQKADIVVSMLPAILHVELAKDCVRYKKHMVTASYISPAMQELNEEVTANNLIFMNEIGLDPGIDHMSAMKIIHDIKNKGGKVISFESFCGGLIAPESDTNLWNYKFTWNPRNVVLAGQGGAAKFLQEGQYKYIPYNKVFRRTEFLNVDGYGKFEAYANRDSLKYKDIYGLDDARTIFRGTIRRVGYSRAWNLFVELGITDDSYKIDNSEEMTYREFINSYLPYHPTDTVETKLRLALGIDQDDIMWDKLLELDLFNPTKKIGLKQATPAQILEKILSDSWTLDPDDKDMIVMYHRIGYELHGEKKQIDSRMVCLGDNQVYTAMAKTVGLPVAIATLKILKGIITTPGVQMPITEDVYEPILKELENYGINFVEDEVPYSGFN